ncbi:MAG: phenylalanine--tRNA ligase subunit alpha [Methanoregula sp.]|jgi:phenylalanyl-tRNA synthetase alpha chain
MAELTQNEKRLLTTLERVKKADAQHLASLLGATPEAVVQWAHLAEDKGLVRLDRCVDAAVIYTDEGKRYVKDGLPETQVLAKIGDGITLAALKDVPAFPIGFGQLRKKGLIAVKDGWVTRTSGASTAEIESALQTPVAEDPLAKELIRRGILAVTESVQYIITITPRGTELAQQGLDLKDEVGTLTREQILSGAWKTANLRRYDVTKLPKKAYPGKVHPYQRIIGEMREILLEMGFEELYGGIVQQCFWNFDALFQPQDHPAREMQDTFYLKETLPLPKGYEKVKAMHEAGGETSSTGWGGIWKEEKARQCVLRTHTTSVSIQHLAQNPNPPVKAFCIGRVYRRETIDTTHLAEFEQLEGVVMDEGVTFGNLLGILREFYCRMGFESVRFKPSYYPYTEPSLDAEVYIEGIGWMEMGGAGVFREEVTAPLGINYPVLAWGLGVSRIAMLRLGLKDLRYLHRSDVAFLRETPSLRYTTGGV